MNLLVLVVCAVAEAVIWMWRLRAGMRGDLGGGAWAAAVSTVLVCVTRCAFFLAGVTAILESDPYLGFGVYCFAAGVATFVAHGVADGWGGMDEKRLAVGDEMTVCATVRGTSDDFEMTLREWCKRGMPGLRVHRDGPEARSEIADLRGEVRRAE